MSQLTQETITFGKYKNSTLGHVLRDRAYCRWLLQEEWFRTNYEYLWNRIQNYDPKPYFFDFKNTGDFLNDYQYFNLKDAESIELPLNPSEIECYKFYLGQINLLKTKILENLENEKENPWDIKAPTSWLKDFEKNFGIPRADFKEFLIAYELPNITSIVETIKAQGGIEYRGAKSFIIAKKRSEDQEDWWEKILKTQYGEDIGTQFRYQNCVFDFINISTNTIFECKLGMKDFNEEQHMKYKLTLNKYRIIYLIARDAVIDMERKKIYTTQESKYLDYQLSLVHKKSPTYLDNLIVDWEIVQVPGISELFGYK